jgi:hypothetical protein
MKSSAPPLDEAQPVVIVGFWKMVIFQWVNPKSWIASASAAASYGSTDSQAAGDRVKFVRDKGTLRSPKALEAPCRRMPLDKHGVR